MEGKTSGKSYLIRFFIVVMLCASMSLPYGVPLRARRAAANPLLHYRFAQNLY
jgi:hypothetical protein